MGGRGGRGEKLGLHVPVPWRLPLLFHCAKATESPQREVCQPRSTAGRSRVASAPSRRDGHDCQAQISQAVGQPGTKSWTSAQPEPTCRSPGSPISPKFRAWLVLLFSSVLLFSKTMPGGCPSKCSGRTAKEVVMIPGDGLRHRRYRQAATQLAWTSDALPGIRGQPTTRLA